MAISLVKTPTGNPSFNLLKNPPRNSKFNIGINRPPRGLVPLGDTGLWTTPSEPADPQDCERYEGSAFCTPFFFTLTPFSFVPSIAIDGCNIGIRADYSFGFIRLPPVAIVYRYPSEACKVPLPQQPNDYSNGGITSYPNHTCNENRQSLTVYWVNHQKKVEDYTVPEGLNFTSDSPGRYFAQSETTINITLIEFPYTGTETPEFNRSNQKWRTGIDFVVGRVHYTATDSYEISQLYRDYYYRDDRPLTGTYTQNSVHYVESGDYIVNMTGTGVTAFGNKAFCMLASTRQAKEYLDSHPLASGVFNFYTPSTFALYNQEIHSSEPLFNADLPYYKDFTFITNWDVKVVCGKESPRNNPPPPPNNNPPPRHCCMSCCPSQGEQDNSLLALLMQKVDKLSEVVGVDDYPISLPTSLISRDEGFLGNLIPNFNRDVPSLTRFLAWYVERFDEIMGQWEIPIEVKDSDPSKPGDQPLGIKLPNMAEAIAEMFTLCFQTNLNSETLLNFAVRTAAEGVADKQQNFITYKLLQSMTEWAGYKQKDIKLKMPTLFSLGKTRYDEILNESEIDVACVDFDEKFGLEAELMRFREAVAILQATYKRKVDPSGDIKAQILKHLLDTFAAVKKVNGEDEDEGFDKFLTDVENGFINEPGANNTR